MNDVLLRFANVRPPQRRETTASIDAYGGGRFATDLRDLLVQALSDHGRAGAREVADVYVAGTGLVSDLSQLQTNVAAFDLAITALLPRPSIRNVEKAVHTAFDGDPAAVAARDAFTADRKRLADSTAAAYFASSSAAVRLSPGVRGLRLLELVERIAAGEERVHVDGGVVALLRAGVTIGVDDSGLIAEPPSVPLVPLYRIVGPRGDHLYTTSAVERLTAIGQHGYKSEGVACHVFPASAPGTVPLFRLLHAPTADHLYTISADERDDAIANSGYVDEDIACYVLAARVPAAAPFHRLLGVGTGHHFYTVSSNERDFAVERLSYVTEDPVGWVYPVALQAPDQVSAGVTDLMIVRQTLRRYELGEIAHVENSLLGESKERTHRRAQTTETLVLTEVETTTESERDLQTSDRFELKSETSKTVQEDMQAQAGITVTAEYGTIKATATGSFAFDRSIEEATQSASSYARDVVARSRDRIETRELQQRTTRSVADVEEFSKHELDNKDGTGHVVGVYRWVDKLYEAQIVNYGKRLMLEFNVPEPAAYHRAVTDSRLPAGLSRQKPVKPVNGDGSELTANHITWPAALTLAATYEAVGVQPPPPDTQSVGASIEVPFTDKEYEKPAPIGHGRVLPALGGTKVSVEIKIPRGYVATSVKWSGDRRAYIRKHPEQKVSSTSLEDQTTVSIGSGTWDGFAGNTVEVAGFVDIVPVAVITSAAGLIMTVRVDCKRTTEYEDEWKGKTYDAIIAGYREQLRLHEEEVASLRAEAGPELAMLPDAEYRRIERRELKRATLSLLTGQHFDGFSALHAVPGADAIARIDFSRSAAEGDVVQFFEQAFEWHNMTYVFYPYFWGRQSMWDDTLRLPTTDPLFDLFLRAGYARVQVPVRLHYDSMVLFYLDSSKLWQESETAPVAKRYLPLVEEIRNQTGDDFTLGAGTLDLVRGQRVVNGAGTGFTTDDIDREVRVEQRVYRIVGVTSATEVEFERPFAADDVRGAAYTLGPKLVGPAWEVRLPTPLVMIDTDLELPSWPPD